MKAAQVIPSTYLERVPLVGARLARESSLTSQHFICPPVTPPLAGKPRSYTSGIKDVTSLTGWIMPMSSVAVFSKASPFDALQRWLPKLVLAPSMLIVLVGFYGYIIWTFVLSFTNSRLHAELQMGRPGSNTSA